MTKSATDVMQEIIFSAVIDSIEALKTASKGLPNNLLRDINAVHRNTTFGDLPPELQTAITATVRSAFTRLLKEGYSVSPGRPAPAQGRPPQRDGAPGAGRGREQRGPGGRDPRGPGGRGPAAPGNRDRRPPRGEGGNSEGPKGPRGGGRPGGGRRPPGG